MRVMILEDDPIIALDLQVIVERCGHDVIGPASCVAEAARLGRDLDFAFLDVDLPDGKSFGLAERLLDAGVDVFFVSASNRADMPACLRGAGFVGKPFSDAAIRNALHPRRALAG